ncbi:MAG: L,D-transpeptidase family protein [Bacteroidota bacterium]
MRKQLLGILILLIALQSCKYLKSKKAIARDTTINQNTSFNNVFLDSAHVDEFVARHAEFLAYEGQFKDFYSHRNYEYAWFDSSGLAEQAHNFINLQNSYISEFADSSLYNRSLQELFDSLHTQKVKPSLQDPKVLRAELMLTGQFFQYAAKVYKGSDINAEQLGWFIPRKKINLTALLDSSLKSKITETDQYAPLNSQYKKLQENLSKYMALEKQSPTDTIVYVTKPLKKKDSAFIITQIKQRLLLLGDMAESDSSSLFDSTLFAATKHFQRRMGLSVDGVIGNKMIAELNVPISRRIRQLLVNMERVRWMPAEKDTNYILVNIPEYKMHVYDSGHQVFDMNVIVGTAANSTVIFNGNLKYVVFSPYWNVPESIVKKEIMPSIQKNKNYIVKSNMEITGYSGKTPLVRQKPGPTNSLGLVKFLFPNNYNIYFHDTPNRELFSQSSRSFSHGCIRLGEPKKFAEYLLRDDNSWTSGKIDTAMHLAKEKWVTIKKSIPVFIVYFTAWVDKDGQLNFRKDIYGHDEKMGEKLFTK